MKFKSGIIAAGSGSFGGMTIAHNRGGLYMRNRTVPTNPGSAQQGAIRNAFGNLSTAWSNLTAAQRAAWTTYAINTPQTDSLGDELVLTGHQMFVRCNTVRLQNGFAAVADGPTVYGDDILSPVSIVFDVTGPEYAIAFTEADGWVDEDDAALVVYVSQQFGPAINYFRGPYRLAGKIDGDSVTAPTSPDTSISPIFAMTAGNRMAARVRTIRADGRISPVQYIGPQAIVAT